MPARIQNSARTEAVGAASLSTAPISAAIRATSARTAGIVTKKRCRVCTSLVYIRRFIQLADNLAAEHGAARLGFTLTEPASTGSAQWDTAIAALCEYRLNAESLPVPEWITARRGFPDEIR